MMKLPIILYFMILGIASCSTKNHEVILEPKIAKTVPAVYLNSVYNGFSNHKDTVYLNDKFFSGFRYTLYSNGDTASLQSYFNGVEEGMQLHWYPNKQLAEKRFYINGKKEGIHEGWWPDGKPKFFFEVYGDEYNGEFKEWYSTGLLGKDFHYKNGQEEGSEKLWWDNGAVRANYVIRNGKKYGFIGLKTCVNPYDSVTQK